MSAWIRGEVDVDDSRDTGAVWIVRVRWEDLNGTYLGYSNAEVGSAAGGLPVSFTEKGGTVTAPAGAAYGRVEVYFYLASGWLNVDDVSVTPTTTVNISETKYYSFGGDTVGMRVDGELSWMFGDQLGSTGVTYQADGSATTRQFYYPFGGIRNPGGAPVVETDVGFTGQRLDTSTGLMFYQARYYDPLTARFISADTMVPDPGNPQDFNRYSYVRNNPLGYTDPSGNASCEWLAFLWTFGCGTANVTDGVMNLNPAVLGGAVPPRDSSVSNEGYVWGTKFLLGFVPYLGAAIDAWDCKSGDGMACGTTLISAIPGVSSAFRGARALDDVGDGIRAIDNLADAGRGADDMLDAAGGLGDDIIRLAERNLTNSGGTVLGSFPGYITKANANGVSYFDIGDAWNTLTPAQRTAANNRFLDVISSRGDRVLLSVPKSQIQAGTALASEVAYLTSQRGYVWVNQWSLRPGG